MFTNPNCEYEVNYVAFHTLGSWYTTPTTTNNNQPFDHRKALQQAVKDWLPRFYREIIQGPGDQLIEINENDNNSNTKKNDSDLVTEEDILLLCDLFYLPHHHGERSIQLISDFKWILDNIPTSNNDNSNSNSNNNSNNSNSNNEWISRATSLQSTCKVLHQLHEKMTEITNRELLYSLYGYTWGIKEEGLLIDQYIAWLLNNEQARKNGGRMYKTVDYPHKVYRGGVLADLQV